MPGNRINIQVEEDILKCHAITKPKKNTRSKVEFPDPSCNPSSFQNGCFNNDRFSPHPKNPSILVGGTYKIQKLTRKNMLDQILENYSTEDLLKADGFDDAVIGIATEYSEPRLIYSVSKCLHILEKDMSELEALEFFEFNVSGAYVGEKTPIWCWDNFL